MGDRATIRIKHSNSDTAIHFYTHWSGSAVSDILAEALLYASAYGRIDDEAYCTRIIFDQLTGLEGGFTGFAIIIGDENRPMDVAHNSPSVEWHSFNSEPHVSMYDLSGDPSTSVPWKEWVKESTLNNLLSHDLTDV
jgi:hypothetical protein